MEFIEKAREGHGCIFCKFRKGKSSGILYSGRYCFIMMNKYPYNNGHMMIIPYSHKSEISDLTSNEQCEMIRLTGQAVKILKKVLKCAGANCGMNIGRVAGAGIAGHVHMHVVPRWKGDFNFLPVIADVKSMPEYIEDTYKKLKPYFAKI